MQCGNRGSDDETTYSSIYRPGQTVSPDASKEQSGRDERKSLEVVIYGPPLRYTAFFFKTMR